MKSIQMIQDVVLMHKIKRRIALLPLFGMLLCFSVSFKSVSLVHADALEQAVKVSTGVSHTCAVLNDQSVKCWGSNIWGQLGNGLPDDSASPVRVVGINNAVSITSLSHSICALLKTGRIKCWGDNFQHELGNEDITDRTSRVPVFVKGIDNAVQIAGGNDHACAVLRTKIVKCWGDNSYGQLGIEDMYRLRTPNAEKVIGLGRVASVTAGNEHTCALMENGHVRCWGSNFSGQVGNGTTSFWVPRPSLVRNVHNVVQIDGGYNQTCARLLSGKMKCWGNNDRGALGTRFRTSVEAQPVWAIGTNTAVDISTSRDMSCTVLENGRTRCWGDAPLVNLGDGTMLGSLSPVRVSGVRTATMVSTGLTHACVVLDDRAIQCWGNNEHGKLGNGNALISDSYVPLDVDL